jgi:hypothetical protein
MNSGQTDCKSEPKSAAEDRVALAKRRFPDPRMPPKVALCTLPSWHPHTGHSRTSQILGFASMSRARPLNWARSWPVKKPAMFASSQRDIGRSYSSNVAAARIVPSHDRWRARGIAEQPSARLDFTIYF